MRAHQIMTRNVLTVPPETSLADAAKTMLENRISALPVVDRSGALVGIISERDFLRRVEIGTQRKRGRWLSFFMSPYAAADEYVHQSGRTVADVMTRDVLAVDEQTTLDEIVGLMERNKIKRVPVMQDGRLVGIVTRANLLRTFADMARDVPDPTADDEHIQQRIYRALQAADWRPLGLQVSVRDGAAHLHGLIVDDRSRQACLVAARNVSGVKEVHDHLVYVDTWSGFYLESPEDMKAAS